MKIVIVSPHRDDAAFSSGLAISAWLRAGHTVHVVNCFTRSSYAPFAEFEMIHSNDRLLRVSALRLREDERWRRLYATAKLVLADLNLKDAPLRLRCRTDEVCGLAVRADDKALEKIAKAVGALKPDALVLPLALGSHVDHLTARSAAMTQRQNGRPTAFYEDLPYATRAGVEESIASIAKEIDDDLAPAFAERAEDASAAAERKRRIAQIYDSQIDDAGTRQIAEFCVPYGGRERLWVDAAWRQSSQLTPASDAVADGV